MLAYYHYRQEQINSIMDMIRDGDMKLWDSSPIIDLMLARMGG